MFEDNGDGDSGYDYHNGNRALMEISDKISPTGDDNYKNAKKLVNQIIKFLPQRFSEICDVFYRTYVYTYKTGSMRDNLRIGGQTLQDFEFDYNFVLDFTQVLKPSALNVSTQLHIKNPDR